MKDFQEKKTKYALEEVSVSPWENIGGHSCDDLAKPGHGWKVNPENVENLEKIIVSTKISPEDLENNFLAELEKKIKIDSLRENFTRNKIIDLLRTQDKELLSMAGRKKHHGDGFGFIKHDEDYYVYLDVPSFAIKSEENGKYYLFGKSRVGFEVGKYNNRFFYNIGMFMIKNNNHPLSEDGEDYDGICIGDNDLPTSGEDIGEVIAKRLKKGKQIVMFGYRQLNESFTPLISLEEDDTFKHHIRTKKRILELGVPITFGN